MNSENRSVCGVRICLLSGPLQLLRPAVYDRGFIGAGPCCRDQAILLDPSLEESAASVSGQMDWCASEHGNPKFP